MIFALAPVSSTILSQFHGLARRKSSSDVTSLSDHRRWRTYAILRKTPAESESSIKSAGLQAATTTIQHIGQRTDQGYEREGSGVNIRGEDLRIRLSQCFL